MARKISDLDRNDLRGALALAEERLDAGTYSADHGQSLAMLQDDPAALGAAFDAMLAKREAAGQPVAILSP